jgi:hypothetical protein
MLKTDRVVIRCFTNTNYDDRPWNQKALGGQSRMVSVDHFGYELRRQLREAAAAGATELPMTSHDLCRSIRAGTAWLNACCEAMQQELQDSDIVVQDRNGLGMSVRYKLPRAI